MEFFPGAELNESQLEAVTQTEGMVRVIAGAGSGKTRTLSARFAYLSLEIGILPSSIVCVTFTSKAAAEMRARIHALTGDDDTGFVGTFHSLCNTILLEEANAIHYPRSFMVIDGEDISSMLQLVYDERQLTSRDMTFSKARDMIEARKNGPDRDYRYDLVNLSLEKLYEKYQKAQEIDDIIFYGYLYQQRKAFALDYDDLIILTLHIFNENPDIARKWQEKVEYLMIDEFQDIDDMQVELMEVLCQVHRNLFVVGDPDQTIYTWRGARVEYLTGFADQHPGCKTIFLNENYRSTKPIIDCANALIAANANRIEKDLLPVRSGGAAVHAGHFENANKEAIGIADAVEHLLSKGYAFSQMAVLYRAHYLSRPIEDVFIERQIPYVIHSGVPFFQRREIKDICAYARMLVFQDDLDFSRTINTPKRNIGKSRMKKLQEYADEHGLSLYQSLKELANDPLFVSTKAQDYIKLIEETPWKEQPVSRIVSKLLDASGYEKMLRLEGAQERLDNLAELRQAIREYEISWGEDTTLEDWVRHIALFQNADGAERSDKVRLMTIHSAKGLEFDCVLMPGLNEGLFPSRKVRTRQGMEEERRLAFVALTRAKSELYLSEAGGLMHQGAARWPSRFFMDIGPEKMVWNPPMSLEAMEQTRRMVSARPSLISRGEGAQSAQLGVGDRIRHKVFGEGTIMELHEQDSAWVIQFDALASPRTLSMRVPLEKIGEALFA